MQLLDGYRWDVLDLQQAGADLYRMVDDEPTPLPPLPPSLMPGQPPLIIWAVPDDDVTRELQGHQVVAVACCLLKGVGR